MESVYLAQGRGTTGCSLTQLGKKLYRCHEVSLGKSPFAEHWEGKYGAEVVPANGNAAFLEEPGMQIIEISWHLQRE